MAAVSAAAVLASGAVGAAAQDAQQGYFDAPPAEDHRKRAYVRMGFGFSDCRESDERLTFVTDDGQQGSLRVSWVEKSDDIDDICGIGDWDAAVDFRVAGGFTAGLGVALKGRDVEFGVTADGSPIGSQRSTVEYRTYMGRFGWLVYRGRGPWSGHLFMGAGLHETHDDGDGGLAEVYLPFSELRRWAVEPGFGIVYWSFGSLGFGGEIRYLHSFGGVEQLTDRRYPDGADPRADVDWEVPVGGWSLSLGVSLGF